MRHIERFCEINVNVPPVEVNIQESSLNLKRGQSYQLNSSYNNGGDMVLVTVTTRSAH